MTLAPRMPPPIFAPGVSMLYWMHRPDCTGGLYRALRWPPRQWLFRPDGSEPVKRGPRQMELL